MPPSTSARTSRTTYREGLVIGLLLEDQERRDDVQAGVDHRRELPREDLERPLLDLLAAPSRRLSPISLSSTGRRPRWSSCSRADVRSEAGDLTLGLHSERVDRVVGERGHGATACRWSSSGFVSGLAADRDEQEPVPRSRRRIDENERLADLSFVAPAPFAYEPPAMPTARSSPSGSPR